MLLHILRRTRLGVVRLQLKPDPQCGHGLLRWPLFERSLRAVSDLPASRVTLIGKPDCHLCDDARRVVQEVCNEFNESFSELSILDDPGLYDEYWERIPVVLVDERVVEFWRINPERLRGALS